MKKPPTKQKQKPNLTLETMVRAAHEAGASISFGLEANNSFYGKMEEGVREWVRMLRNAGINTVASSHQEGYIQAISTDPTEELTTIFNVLHGRVPGYEVSVFYGNYSSHQIQNLCIRSPAFKLTVPAPKTPVKKSK